MHERERSQFILTLLRERAVVTVRDLQALTGASAATVRRDLQALTEAGLVRRVHGGVESVDKIAPKALAGSDSEVARRFHAERKRAIAAAAVALAEDGESIIINAGSTTYAMAEPLIGRRLHILTNSFPMAQTLVATTDNRIVLPGGEVYRKQGIVISPFDDDAIQHYTASKMFMSCYSIGPMGVIEADPLIARAEAKLLRRADRLIVLADSSKFEARGALAVAPLSRVSMVITDDAVPKTALTLLRDAGIDVKVVPVSAGAARESTAA